MLVKHLEHRNLSKQPKMQVEIINVATYLAKHKKIQASVAITTAITDVMRHLRKCMQFCLESSDPESDRCKWNAVLYSSLEDCLVQLINKVRIWFLFSSILMNQTITVRHLSTIFLMPVVSCSSYIKKKSHVQRAAISYHFHRKIKWTKGTTAALPDKAGRKR